jgi:hypothetical protein
MLLLAACEKEDKVMKDFQAFYDAFHQDTTFQLEHIIFPLEGIPAGADSIIASRKKFFWNKEDWTYHKPYDFENGEFSHQFIRYSDDLIAERIEHNTGSYGMLRRFAKYGDDWYLIYYAASNRLKPKPKIDIEGGF